MLHLSLKRPLYKQVPKKFKKLVTISVFSTSMIKKTEELEQVPCIWYPVTFKDQTKALLDLESEVNVISQAFAQQLSLKICKTNVGVEKIDGTILETYGIVISTFSLLDKDDRERFLKESFLLVDIKLDIVLGMPFLIMSNAEVDFQAQGLKWRSYIIGDIPPTTRQVELIKKKEFVVAALDPKHEAVMIHVATLSKDLGDDMYLSRKAQIAYLKVDEAPFKVPGKYTDFANVFFSEINCRASKIHRDQ